MADDARGPGFRPLHPVLVHFPIAFWIGAAALDAAAWVGLLPSVRAVDGYALSQLLSWAGVIAALPTIALGLIDYARLPGRVQESGALRVHILSMGGAFLLFLVAAIWTVKAGALAGPPPAGAVILELIGAAALIVGGHFASRVVFELLP